MPHHNRGELQRTGCGQERARLVPSSSATADKKMGDPFVTRPP